MARKPQMDTTKRGKFTEVLEQLVAGIAGGFVEEFKDSIEVARKRAELAMSKIQAEASGTGIYIAKGHLWHISEKHRRIYRRFTGSNHAQLAREFDLTERQIYSIIALVGQEEFDKKQCKLFEE
jgi:Mor family transcriptional regulator